MREIAVAAATGPRTDLLRPAAKSAKPRSRKAAAAKGKMAAPAE